MKTKLCDANCMYRRDCSYRYTCLATSNEVRLSECGDGETYKRAVCIKNNLARPEPPAERGEAEAKLAEMEGQ